MRRTRRPLLRSAAAAVESDSDEVAGYLAECGGSETEGEDEKRAKASSAPVSAAGVISRTVMGR